MAGVGRAEEQEQHLNGELPPEPEDKDGAAGLGAEDGAKKKRKKKKKGRAGPAGRGRAGPRPCADGLGGVEGPRAGTPGSGRGRGRTWVAQGSRRAGAGRRRGPWQRCGLRGILAVPGGCCCRSFGAGDVLPAPVRAREVTASLTLFYSPRERGVRLLL